MPKIEGKHTKLIAARISFAYSLILSNRAYRETARNKELTQKVREEFNVESRTAQRYIKEARERFKAFEELEAAEYLKEALIDREYLIEQLKQKGDHRLLLEAYKDRDKLRGLYTDQIEQSMTTRITFVDNLDE